MITILIYAGLFLLALWIMEKIPGLHLIAKPLFDSILITGKFIFLHSSFWLLWVFRSFITSHKVFFQHLVTPRKILNPSEEARAIRKSL